MAAKVIPWDEAHANKPVVLVVEDESLIRIDIAEELRRRGCQVIEAANADQAIDALRSTARIDLVVTDVRMPGARDGLDVAHAAREQRPGVRIAVMSGHLLPTDRHKHLIDLFVSKPTSSTRLAMLILGILEAVPAARNG